MTSTWRLGERGAVVDGPAWSRPLDRRLARCSLAMAFRPGFELTEAADVLREMAAGNRTALVRALAFIRGGAEARSGPVSERAADALRSALTRG